MIRAAVPGVAAFAVAPVDPLTDILARPAAVRVTDIVGIATAA